MTIPFSQSKRREHICARLFGRLGPNFSSCRLFLEKNTFDTAGLGFMYILCRDMLVKILPPMWRAYNFRLHVRVNWTVYG
jgi:hypothetical protein